MGNDYVVFGENGESYVVTRKGEIKDVKHYNEELMEANKKGEIGPTGPVGQIGYVKECCNIQRKPRGAILDEAKKIINGERQDQYGNPEDNFSIITEFWGVYNKARKGASDRPLDTAMKMALLKVARIATGTGTADSFTDACGYIALAADMSNYKENGND